MKDRVEHLREGEGDHDEIDSRRAHDQEADGESGEGGGGHGCRQSEPKTGGFILWRDQRDGVGGHAEVSGMAEADESGMADEQIEAQSEDRHDHDLGAKLEVKSRCA